MKIILFLTSTILLLSSSNAFGNSGFRELLKKCEDEKRSGEKRCCSACKRAEKRFFEIYNSLTEKEQTAKRNLLQIAVKLGFTNALRELINEENISFVSILLTAEFANSETAKLLHQKGAQLTKSTKASACREARFEKRQCKNQKCSQKYEQFIALIQKLPLQKQHPKTN
jgi:hypothetical protein